MFRIVCDPSSGSTELFLTEITLNGSQKSLCAWSVFRSVIFNQRLCVRYDGLGTTVVSIIPNQSYRAHTPQVQNFAAKHRPSTGKFL